MNNVTGEKVNSFDLETFSDFSIIILKIHIVLLITS